MQQIVFLSLGYLDGKAVTQDHVIACEQVTAQNVGNYQSFK